MSDTPTRSPGNTDLNRSKSSKAAKALGSKKKGLKGWKNRRNVTRQATGRTHNRKR